MTCAAYPVKDTNFWAALIDVCSVTNGPPDSTEGMDTSHEKRSPIALHFVIDNSGSMGRMTTEVKNIFSELVDSTASKPCSLTLFSENSTLLSADIKSSKQMLDLPQPPQGLTNIPAGVRQAIEVITSTEMSELSNKIPVKTHHILILLTDGMHNSGATPATEFPQIGRETRETIPDAQISVVAVGITRESSTSMGMSLKTSLETVPLDGSVDDIYFAPSRSAMHSTMAKLVDSFNAVSNGTIHSISCPLNCIVADLGSGGSSAINARTTPDDRTVPVLFIGEEAPHHVNVDGNDIEVVENKELDQSLLARILKNHINKIRIKRVGSTASSVQSAILQLGELINSLEKELKEKGRTNLSLARASAADRLAQHRNIVKTVHVGRELRNQLADVANFAASCSEEQAAFLTGSRSKYASKALRRAAVRTGNSLVVEPKKELGRVHSELREPRFVETLRLALVDDAVNQLGRLSEGQREKLDDHVMACSETDVEKLRKTVANLDAIASSVKGAVIQNEAKGTEKVHTSALCWIPPGGDTYDAIQTIRQKHDRHIKRWPPHVNLLYPFLPSADFEDAAKKLAKALKSIGSFDITLSEIRHFAHSSKSYTAWLHPEDPSAFVALQDACQSAFPQCNDLVKRGAFVPHLTVGQCTSKSSTEALTSAAGWVPAQARCGEVCLISRKGQDEPFEVHWRVQLGTGVSTAMPASMPATSPTNTAVAGAAESGDDVLSSVDSETKQFLSSGALAGYLDDVFFGERRSYLSLMSPREHAAEWVGLIDDESPEFESQWEMLLYAGLAAYPIVVERSAGTQMNPFQLSIKKVHTTMIDTASLCCANHSGFDTYGPEGGEPIKDALVLVDPSCPRASAKIASSALLGETFTSVVLSRDLHMYTGAQMKAALHAHSLFRCLQPEAEKLSEQVAAAEIRRRYLGGAYQCPSCGFGPVDHGGCSDLSTHHGEADDGGGVASNACPSCGWFSDRLSSWKEWDGTIPPALLAERMTGRDDDDEGGPHGKVLLEARADMILRILYSFRKTFGGLGNPIRAFYGDLARRLADWDLRLTTRDDVDGLVQVLVAAAACDDDYAIGDDGAVGAAFAPPVLLAIVNEACARAARQRLRKETGGDEAKVKALAVGRVTRMLSVTEESAPDTAESLLEPEPEREAVEAVCRQDYRVDFDAARDEIEHARRIADGWCRALQLVRALRTSIVRRGGGWDRLERDMETSLDDYADVVRDVAAAGGTVRPFAEACDVAEADEGRTLAAMAAQALLHNRGSSRGDDLPDVRDGDALREMAKDMRMHIYSRRVKEKLDQWTSEGRTLTFLQARASDIGQYTEMVTARQHVHGLSREMFWGLWEAAAHDGHRGEKVRAFLETATETFRLKYAPEGEQVHGKMTRKNRRAGKR